MMKMQWVTRNTVFERFRGQIARLSFRNFLSFSFAYAMQPASTRTLLRRASLWKYWLNIRNGPLVSLASYIAIGFLVLCAFVSLFCFFLVVTALDDFISRAAPRQLWRHAQARRRSFLEKIKVHLEDLQENKSIRAFVATVTDYMQPSRMQQQ